LILLIGAKACCIIAGGAGGITNWVVNRSIRWLDLVVAVFVGWVAAELFIPPIMQHFELAVVWGPAIAFVIGYCGIRLLPVLEGRLKRMIEKS
jgi:predicted membrane channel-forming protein YqfA (hemolysin III family)